jgi:hypothetical protein
LIPPADVHDRVGQEQFADVSVHLLFRVAELVDVPGWHHGNEGTGQESPHARGFGGRREGDLLELLRRPDGGDEDLDVLETGRDVCDGRSEMQAPSSTPRFSRLRLAGLERDVGWVRAMMGNSSARRRPSTRLWPVSPDAPRTAT